MIRWVSSPRSRPDHLNLSLEATEAFLLGSLALSELKESFPSPVELQAKFFMVNFEELAEANAQT